LAPFEVAAMDLRPFAKEIQVILEVPFAKCCVSVNSQEVSWDQRLFGLVLFLRRWVWAWVGTAGGCWVAFEWIAIIRARWCLDYWLEAFVPKDG